MDSKTILSLLGTFWSLIFPTSQVEELTKARWLLDFIRRHQRDRIIKGADRHDDFPLDVKIWHPIVIRESELSDEDGFVYGDPTYYGAGEVYGGPLIRFKKFKLPEEFFYTPTLTDKIVHPDLILIYDRDFIIKDGYLWLRGNPFTNYSKFVKEDSEGKFIKLWATRLYVDEGWSEDRLGCLLGVDLPASEESWKWENRVLDAIVDKASFGRFQQLIANALGIEVAQEDEIVEEIYQTGDYVTIVTDKNAYTFPDSLSPVVSAGDRLVVGSRLVDLFEVIQLQRGELPSWIAQVDIPQFVLGEGFTAGLSFPNRDVALEVDTSGNYTRVKFEILGQKQDIDHFWNEVNSRGEGSPPTLAHLLAGYTTPPSREPSVNELPRVINPAKFLLGNFLRNHWVLVVLQSVGRSKRGLPRYSLDKMQKALPPWVGILFVEVITFNPEVVDPTNTDASLGPGASDNNELFIALEPLSETVDDTYVTDSVSLSFTEESC